jgi:hypothetical protein
MHFHNIYAIEHEFLFEKNKVQKNCLKITLKKYINPISNQRPLLWKANILTTGPMCPIRVKAIKVEFNYFEPIFETDLDFLWDLKMKAVSKSKSQ